MEKPHAMDAKPDAVRGACLFGDVRIEWTISTEGTGGANCAVRVKWQAQAIVQAVLDRSRPSLDFETHDEATPMQRVSGALSFDAAAGILRLMSLRYPGGGTGEQQLFPAAANPQAEHAC